MQHLIRSYSINKDHYGDWRWEMTDPDPGLSDWGHAMTLWGAKRACRRHAARGNPRPKEASLVYLVPTAVAAPAP